MAAPPTSRYGRPMRVGWTLWILIAFLVVLALARNAYEAGLLTP